MGPKSDNYWERVVNKSFLALFVPIFFVHYFCWAVAEPLCLESLDRSCIAFLVERVPGRSAFHLGNRCWNRRRSRRAVNEHVATARNIRLGPHTQTHTRSIPRSIGYGSKGGWITQLLVLPLPQQQLLLLLPLLLLLLLLPPLPLLLPLHLLPLLLLHYCCYCDSLPSLVLPPPQI